MNFSVYGVSIGLTFGLKNRRGSKYPGYNIFNPLFMAMKIRGEFNISRPLFLNPLYDSNENQREVQNIASILF